MGNGNAEAASDEARVLINFWLIILREQIRETCSQLDALRAELAELERRRGNA